MAEYKITKKRLAQIIKEEYQRIQSEEAKKPDFLDLDKDGNKEEPMEDAAEDKEEKEGGKKEKKKDKRARSVSFSSNRSGKEPEVFNISPDDGFKGNYDEWYEGEYVEYAESDSDSDSSSESGEDDPAESGSDTSERGNRPPDPPEFDNKDEHYV